MLGDAKAGPAIKAHYPADQPLTADVEFMEWIANLEKIMVEFGEKHEGHPYGGPLMESTGLACWHDYFKDDYSPEAAFDEDRTYWD